MSEASGGSRRIEVDRRLVQRSLEDEDFRQRLLADPRAAVEQELGSRLPESIEVRVVEESADTLYLVLPNVSAVGEEGEISDQELEVVAGGFGGGTDSGDTCGTPACYIGGYTCDDPSRCG